LTEGGFRAGLEVGRGNGTGVCSFVDSMFYIMIFRIKGTRKGRIMVFASSIQAWDFFLDAPYARHYDEFHCGEPNSDDP
jgi:hypothetical protein